MGCNGSSGGRSSSAGVEEGERERVDERVETPPAETTPVETTFGRERAPAAGPCRAEAPNVLLAPAPEVPAVAVAPGLVVFPESDATLVVQPIDAGARADGEALHVSIDGARSLFALRWVGDRFVVLTEHDTGSARMIVAQALDARAAPIGDPVRIGLPERLLTTKIRATDDALYLARSHARAAPALDRLELRHGGIAHETFALGLAHEPRDRRVEILGLAAEGDRWAVAWRAGAAEATDSEVVITSNAPFGRAARTRDVRGAGSQRSYEVAVEALHHALAIEAFGFDGEAIVAVAAHEMSRPALVRVSRDSERATPIERGAEIAAPFAAQLSARARATDDRLVLELRDAAGDRVGETLVAAGLRDAVADVARIPGGFLVAYAAREANGRVVNAAHVACAGSAARAGD